MHTLIRDQETTKHDFVFYADRLIRLVRTALYTLVTITENVPSRVYLAYGEEVLFLQIYMLKDKLKLLCVDSGTWTGSFAVH